MPVRTRRSLFLILLAIFLAQTWLVYSDPSGRKLPALSREAAEGQRVWLSHNCQACHQVFGFGGFLGPDLTNVAGRALAHLGVEATEEQRRLAFADRFEGTLTTGSERMPAFELSREERVALGAFFVELDRRGVGQASAGKDEAPREILARLLDRQLGTGVEGLSDLEARGRSIVEERGCIDCHLPNARSAFRAPDLTTLLEAAGEERLAEVLRDGIPAKGMPRFGLGMEEARAVTAFLGWLAEHREPLRRGFEAAERGGEGSLAGLPWFEYE